MTNSDSSRLGPYLVLKQLGKSSAEQWLREQAGALAARHVDVDALRRIVLL